MEEWVSQHEAPEGPAEAAKNKQCCPCSPGLAFYLPCVSAAAEVAAELSARGAGAEVSALALAVRACSWP